MRIVARIALIVTLAMGLAGCYDVIAVPDIATAAVYGPHISRPSLTPQQIAQLSSWIKSHDAGWRHLMETPPAPITLAIVMHEASSQQSTFNLFEAKDGSATVYFYAPSPAPPRKRYVSQADVAALWAAVKD